MEKIYVQRKVEVWVEDIYKVEEINDEVIKSAINYELDFERISEYYIVYTKDSKEELEENTEFLQEVDETIVELYYNYGEEDEDWESFQEGMGIIRIEDWTEEDGNDYPIIYDER